jgi:hypothetical protein
MLNPQIAIGAGLVALVASVAVYSSFERPLRPAALLPIPAPSATALPPAGGVSATATLRGMRRYNAVLGELSAPPIVLGGDPVRPVLGGAPLGSVLGGAPIRPVLGGAPLGSVLGGAPIRPVLGGDLALPAAASAPRAAAADGAERAARRLLALLPGEDCPQLIRFADGQSDRYRGERAAQGLVNALEAAQQFCYQRERFPEIARERRQEAERFAKRFLAGRERHSALRR